MAVETLDDRKVLLADFGVACTGSPTGGGSVSFTAIYDAQHALEEAGGFVAFSLDQPRLTCVTSEVSTLAEGDTVTVPVDAVNTDYTIRVVMPDGTGITELALEKQ
jgi:archaellum component FlaF (FlaF/FlaG flagellin family)